MRHVAPGSIGALCVAALLPSSGGCTGTEGKAGSAEFPYEPRPGGNMMMDVADAALGCDASSCTIDCSLAANCATYDDCFRYRACFADAGSDGAANGGSNGGNGMDGGMDAQSPSVDDGGALSPCVPSPCGANADACIVNDAGAPSCVCKGGFSGTFCDVPDDGGISAADAS